MLVKKKCFVQVVEMNYCLHWEEVWNVTLPVSFLFHWIDIADTTKGFAFLFSLSFFG